MIEQALIKTLGFGAKEFISKALHGGWNTGDYQNVPDGKARIEMLSDEPHAYLLNPLAWQAVGKVEGWSDSVRQPWQHRVDEPSISGWAFEMLRFVEALIETV